MFNIISEKNVLYNFSFNIISFLDSKRGEGFKILYIKLIEHDI